MVSLRRLLLLTSAGVCLLMFAIVLFWRHADGTIVDEVEGSTAVQQRRRRGDEADGAPQAWVDETTQSHRDKISLATSFKDKLSMRMKKEEYNEFVVARRNRQKNPLRIASPPAASSPRPLITSRCAADVAGLVERHHVDRNPLIAPSIDSWIDLFALVFPTSSTSSSSLRDARGGAGNIPLTPTCIDELHDAVTDWAVTVVGGELRRMHKKNQGVLYVSLPSRCNFVALGRSFRKGWYPQKLVAKVAKKTHTNFTLMYLTFHDADVWTISATDRGHDHIYRFLRNHPNVFFLHCSPTTELSSGTLFRTVPIPHAPSEIVFIDFPAIRVPYEQRIVKKVAWRGSTTGEYQKPYSHTDRYRMVKAFQPVNLLDRSDVAFGAVAQGRSIPEFRIGQPISRRHMMHYKATLDVDGNTNSWEGLRWKLLAGAAVVKVRSGLGFVQWYYHRMRSGEELIETDVEHVVSEAMRVVDNATLGTHLAEKALAFGEKYLTPAAVDEAVWDLIGNVWRYGYDFGKDWRIRHQ